MNRHVPFSHVGRGSVQWIDRGTARRSLQFRRPRRSDRSGAAGQLPVSPGQPITWDAANLRVTNAPDAKRLIDKEDRKGWAI